MQVYYIRYDGSLDRSVGIVRLRTQTTEFMTEVS
jgi:hypothetical protein